MSKGSSFFSQEERVMSKRVYCSACYHFDGNEDCFHPLNIRIVQTWKKAEQHYIKKPSEINARNDCKLYETLDEHKKNKLEGNK